MVAGWEVGRSWSFVFGCAVVEFSAQRGRCSVPGNDPASGKFVSELSGSQPPEWVGVDR